MAKGSPKMLIVLAGAGALLVGAIASLALNNWIVLVVVMALHAVGSAVVVGYGFMVAAQDEDKPDAVTQARLEEEGGQVSDEPALPGTPS